MALSVAVALLAVAVVFLSVDWTSGSVNPLVLAAGMVPVLVLLALVVARGRRRSS